MMTKVRQYRATLSQLQAQLRKLDAKEREDLLATADSLTPSEPQAASEILRQEAEHGQRLLDQAGRSIARSTAVALESEQVGSEIVTDLGTQRETLVRARARLQETDAELGRSRRAVRRLYFGLVKNKAALILVIVVEVLILAGLVYYKFFS